MAGIPIDVIAQSATQQSSLAGVAVSEPPVVLVVDVDGFGVPGVSVAFAVTAGSGSVAPASVVTDSNGLAGATSWTLDATPGANSVTATALSLDPVEFTATGTEPPAHSIEANSPASQSATVNTGVATPPSVLVRDSVGNPKAGVLVGFGVAQGGGAISPATAVTGVDGVASASSWTVGPTAGTDNNQVQVSVAGLIGDPVFFTASGTAGPAANIAAASPLQQSATIGTAVPSPPAARVTDALGNPVAGHSVNFAVTGGGGSISPASDLTDASGIASASTWTLGGFPGPNSAEASAAGLGGSPVTYSAEATSAPATLDADSVLDQSAGTSTNVPASPAVLVRDGGGNPLAGITVGWTILSGGGSVAGGSVSGPDGVARLDRWTLGAVAGANSVRADIGEGVPTVTFTATGLTLTATQMAPASTTPQSGAHSTAVADPPAVLVRDASNRPVAGVAVAFAVVTGGGAVVPASPTTVLTDADGIARATSWTLGSTVGTATDSVQATSGSLAGSPSLFTASATAGPPALLVADSALSQTAPIGTPVAQPPAARVTDAQGNPVAGVGVGFALVAGDGSTAPGTPVTIPTNAQGRAALTRWTLGSVSGTGQNRVAASVAGLGGSPVTFTGTGVAGGSAPVSAEARPPVERVEVWSNLVCLGGRRLTTMMAVTEVTVESRFEGIVQVKTLTVRYTRSGWEQRHLLQHHRVLRLHRTDDDFDEFRVTQITDASGESETVTVTALDPLQDLATRGNLLTETTSGVVSFTVSVVGKTLAALLVERILPAATPGEFAIGVTQSGTVSLTLTKSSPLASLVAGVEELNRNQNTAWEIAARRNGTTNYLIDVAVVGASAPMARFRSRVNLLAVTRERSTADQVTRLLVIDSTGRGVGDNAWLVTAVSTDAWIEIASLSGGIGPSIEANQLAGLAWIDAGGTGHAITGSQVVSTGVTRLLMTSTTGVVAGDWGRLALNTAGDDLSVLDLPSAQAVHGVLTRDLPGNREAVTNWTKNPDFSMASNGVVPDFWTVGPQWKLSSLASFGGSRAMASTGLTGTGLTQDRSFRMRVPGIVVYSLWVLVTTPGAFTFTTRDPETGSDINTSVPLATPNVWTRVDVSYPVTTPTPFTRVTITGGFGAANTRFIGAIMVTTAAGIPFVVGSGGARNIQQGMQVFQTKREPVVSYGGRLADLTRLDRDSWPYDQLHHGGILDITDDDLAEVFSVRVQALTEDHLNPLQSQVTLSTAPRRLSTLLRSVV